MTNNAYIPGATLRVSFTTTLESSDATWDPDLIPDPDPDTIDVREDIDLPGNGFRVGRATTGVYLDLYYQDSLSEEDIQSRVDFMRRYIGWPVIIDANGDLFPFFLNRVTREADDFGDVQVYLRDSYMGNMDANLAEVPVQWTSLVALVEYRMLGVDGMDRFPAEGEEPTISYEEMESEIYRVLRVTRHEITDTVRSPDDTVLIQSQEIVEGMMGVEGPSDLVIGADVRVPSTNANGISFFQLARVRRVDTYRAEIRLERTID